MLVLNGAAPVEFIFDCMDPTRINVIYGIDDSENIVGNIQLKAGNTLLPGYPQNKDIGFKVNANAPDAKTNPQLIEDRWSAFAPGGLIIRGINTHGDLVGQINSGALFEAFIIMKHGLPSETYVNVATAPMFSGLNPKEVVISGINSAREFVGWHTTAGLQHGIVGKVSGAGDILWIEEVNYEGTVVPNLNPLNGTQLFGISESGLIIGTFNNITPFLCQKVNTPRPQDTHPSRSQMPNTVG